MLHICQHCGATQVKIGDKPDFASTKVTHGSCPRCFLRVDMPGLRKFLDDPDPEKITNEDIEDFTAQVRELESQGLVWLTKEGRPVYEDDMEIKKLAESAIAQFYQENGERHI